MNSTNAANTTGGKFRLSFTYRFEAAHRFTGSSSESCMTPHGHTWRAKAIFEADESVLGPDNMVLEFSQLKGAWKTFIDQTVDHSFLHHYTDPILPALRQAIPKFRGLPFPGDPTTEVIAALFFAKLQVMCGELGPGVSPIAVTIRETPTNSVTIRSGQKQESVFLNKLNLNFHGWWQVADPAARFIEPKKS